MQLLRDTRFRRTRADPAALAAAIAVAEGWRVIRGPDAGSARGAVSVVVSGGALRGPAVLTVAVAPGGTGEPAGTGRRDAGAPSREAPGSGILSAHLPQVLAPPRIRRMRGSDLTVQLREHPACGTLADLLADGRALYPGEAVTLLAAVARGIADVQHAGHAGIPLTPADIGFRDDGCPVLTGVGRQYDVERPDEAHRSGPLDDRAIRADLASYAALARTVCRAVPGAVGAAVLAAATDPVHRSWDDVIAAVLRAADPTAVRAAAHARPPDLAERGQIAEPVAARRVRSRLEEDAPRRRKAGPTRRRGRRRGARRRGAPGRGALTAEAPGRSGPSAGAPAGGPSGRAARLLDGVERVLDAVGDRPVGQGIAAARRWASDRPLLIAVAALPVIAVVLVLVVLPGPTAGAG